MIRCSSLLLLASSIGVLCPLTPAAAQVEAWREREIANFVLKPRASTRIAQASSAPKTPRSAAPKSQVQLTEEGPWGQIEYFTTQLEVPLDLLKLWEVPSLSLDWVFVGVERAEVESVFRALTLPEAIRADLLDPDHWRTEGGNVVISPSPDTIENLPAEVRNSIYSLLARYPENRFHFEPTIVPGGDVAQWLGPDALRPEILAMIQKTLHHRGKTAIFSDKALVLRMAQSDDERLMIRKKLSRTATLVCKLRLGPDANAAKLAEYWSSGQRSKEIEPFLDSMINTAGVERIDLVNLLPASVRKLLYTFPNETHGLAGYYPDCHWTSLNFFNYEPLQRLAEPPMATAYTIENYAEVPKAERLGDILFLMDKEKGTAYHSCVYIADDIVYTKNGRSRLSPWVLMKLENLRELYGIYQDTVTVTYRRKTLK